MDSGDVVEDNCIEYSAIEVVVSDCNPPFPQIVNPVSTVPSVERSSDPVPVEKEKAMWLLTFLLDSLLMDKQVCIFDVSLVIVIGQSLALPYILVDQNSGAPLLSIKSSHL